MFKQTLYTALHDRAGIERKARVPAERVTRLRNAAEKTGLFVPAGRELKCPIDRVFTNAQMESLVEWCESVAQALVERGPKATVE